MKLIITSKAKNELNELIENKNDYLLLYYDTEGCGCGVNGIPTIRFVKTKEKRFENVENEDFSVIIHEQQATFFAKEMKIDFIKSAFRLSSPEGILNPIISKTEILKGDVF